MADLFQAMLQRLDQQLFFRLRMGLQQRFDQMRQRPDLRDCLEPGHGALGIVEQVVENGVFRQQRFGNFHRNGLNMTFLSCESFRSIDLATNRFAVF